MCGKPGHKNLDCRLIEKITKEDWRITKNKSKKKNSNVQCETSDNEVSESEGSNQETIVENVTVPHSGAHTLG